MGQEFQGDGAVEYGVLSLVDHTHSTTAELYKYFVMLYSFADHRFRNIIEGW